MTEEQKTRIASAQDGECNTFDEMPMHSHYSYYLWKSGFTSISDIEALTEEEFIERVHSTFKDKETYSMCKQIKGVKRVAQFLIARGVRFADR